jgi:hypothetical protein
MTTTLVMATPNFQVTFVIEMDTFDGGIGAVLTQQGKTLAYKRVVGHP